MFALSAFCTGWKPLLVAFEPALNVIFLPVAFRRTVWGTSLKGQTKTGEDDDEPGLIPIIVPLLNLLDAVKPEHGFMFTGSRGGTLDLENFADRVMKPALKAHRLQWHGWHAYRRGLATNLKQMDVDDLTIQAILGHRDVASTRTFCIKTVPSVVREAMLQHGEKVGCAMNWQVGIQEPA